MVSRRLVKYLAVGVLNTVFGYSLYALFIYLGIHYSVAVLQSTVLGVLFNFKTIGSLVFRSRNNALIFRFVAVYGLTYLLNVEGLKLMNSFAVNLYLAGFLMLIPLTVLSFVLHNRFVFRENVTTCR